jgi:hypothetical protein
MRCDESSASPRISPAAAAESPRDLSNEDVVLLNEDFLHKLEITVCAALD